jgi:hypothetical protein
LLKTVECNKNHRIPLEVELPGETQDSDSAASPIFAE